MTMSPGTTTLGTHMKRRRNVLGINQSEAARRATDLRRALSGPTSPAVGRTTWVNWEAGRQIPEEFNDAFIEGVLRWKSGSVRTALAGGEPTPLPIAPVTDLAPREETLPPDDDFVRELRGMNLSPAHLELLVRLYWADREREEKQIQEKFRGLAKSAEN
jgi:hypothetical protein